MRTYISGVWVKTGLGFAKPTMQTLVIPHGEPASVLVDVVLDDLTKPDLSAGTLTFRIVETSSGMVLWKTTASPDRYGRGELTVNPPAATMTPGTYAWDLWLSIPGTPAILTQVCPQAALVFSQSSL